MYKSSRRDGDRRRSRSRSRSRSIDPRLRGELELIRQKQEQEIALQEHRHHQEMLDFKLRRGTDDPRTSRAFDGKDKAPEDRLTGFSRCSNVNGNWPYNTGLVSLDDLIIKGTFHIVGVNYARYETAKSNPELIYKFQKAICQDILAEVGSGAVTQDVILKLTPGAIENVVLNYSKKPTPDLPLPPNPELADATWRIKVDYVIKARNHRAQHNIASAMFNALTTEYNIGSRTGAAYVRYLDPTHSADDVQIVLPPEHLKKQKESNAPRLAALPPGTGYVPASGGGLLPIDPINASLLPPQPGESKQIAPRRSPLSPQAANAPFGAALPVPSLPEHPHGWAAVSPHIPTPVYPGVHHSSQATASFAGSYPHHGDAARGYRHPSFDNSTLAKKDHQLQALSREIETERRYIAESLNRRPVH
ncbi:hypothetical protein DIPPA_14557 [Diplonema papillatum]|nr:hypothetical protein DIPPA_14557 [Diplonema papillatum]